MPRYIDADALKEALRNLTRWVVKNGEKHNEGFTYDQVFFCIDARPTAYVPDRKVGKWIVIMDEPTITFDECKCSECGVVEYFNKGWKKFNFCPNCGAEMKGESDAAD